MTDKPASPRPGGAIETWLAEGRKRPRGKGGRSRLGDIARFLRREAAAIRRAREDHGLTWNEVSAAAAEHAGVARDDGTPFPGATFSTIWGRLVRTGRIPPDPGTVAEAHPDPIRPPNAETPSPSRPAPSPPRPVPVTAVPAAARPSGPTTTVTGGLRIPASLRGGGGPAAGEEIPEPRPAAAAKQEKPG